MSINHNKPTRIIHSLDEVSKITDLSIDEILQCAAQGEISLFIKVLPSMGIVESVNACTLDIPEGKCELGYSLAYDLNHVHPAKFSKFIEEKIRRIIDGLIISTKDCLEILRQGSISQIVFKSGIVFQDLLSPAIVFPNSSKFSDNTGRTNGLIDWYFAVYPNQPTLKYLNDLTIVKQPCYLEINASSLFVTSVELQKFQQALLKPPTRDLPNDPFIHHENKAQLLVTLDQAAFELFGNHNPYVLRKYNSIKAIETYLKDKHGFSANVASAAAKIIKPDANQTSETIKSVHYRTEGLVKLINAWSHFYKNADLKDIGTFASKEDVAAWLAEEFEVSFDAEDKKSFPMKLSTIIRPENAKAGTRNPKIKTD